jgi:hypothetical protein
MLVTYVEIDLYYEKMYYLNYLGICLGSFVLGAWVVVFEAGVVLAGGPPLLVAVVGCFDGPPLII